MLTILVTALFCSLIDLFDIQGDIYFLWGFLILLATSWIGWSITLFVQYGEKRALYDGAEAGVGAPSWRFVGIAGSVSLYLVVSSRPGWSPDILGGLGVSGGLFVMLWAFGPGLILLFMRYRQKKESRQRI